MCLCLFVDCGGGVVVEYCVYVVEWFVWYVVFVVVVWIVGCMCGCVLVGVC